MIFLDNCKCYFLSLVDIIDTGLIISEHDIRCQGVLSISAVAGAESSESSFLQFG